MGSTAQENETLMTQMDQAPLAYLARRDVSMQWSGFLRALLDTLDAHLDRQSRDALLRAVGERFGAGMPLPTSETLASLETRMNEILASMTWGQVRLELDPQDRALLFIHTAAPCISTPADEDGAWLGPVLEGLYSNWLTAQQGTESGPAMVRLSKLEPGLAVLRFGS
jgi:hypothetical protein